MAGTITSAVTARVPFRLAAACLLLLGVGVGTVRLTQPLDVGEPTWLPDWIVTLKQRDDVAYPAHRALATALEALHYPREAAALQWLKAATHARDADERTRAVEGLARLRSGAASAQEFDATICSYILGGGRGRDAAAAARAGLRCATSASP